MKFNGKLILFTVFLVAITVVCKIQFGGDINFSGFSPVIAIALFSGFIVKQRNASFLLPLAALFISDAVIQFLYSIGEFKYPGFYTSQWKIYLMLLFSATVIGWLLKGRKFSSVVVGAFVAPTVFYLISNFAVWVNPASEVTYTRDFNGLMNCYESALPFYRNSLIATVAFLPVIILSYNYIIRKKASLSLA